MVITAQYMSAFTNTLHMRHSVPKSVRSPYAKLSTNSSNVFSIAPGIEKTIRQP